MKLRGITFLVAGLMIALCTPAHSEQTPSLRAFSEVTERAIRLSDVFENIAQDKDAEIAVAPEPGKSVTYDAHVLGRLALQHSLPWKPRSLGDRIVIKRLASLITADMIQEAVLLKLREANPSLSPSTEILFDNRNLSVALPAGQALDFSLTAFSYDQQNKRFQAELVAKTNDRPVNKSVTGRVVLKRSVPVLAHHLVAGTVLGERDLNWVDVREEQVGIDILAKQELIVGQELRHDQPEGAFFRARDLAPPRLVTRGGLVTMKIETPLMLITTQGKALQDGAKGDVIRVTNLQSKRVVEGIIEADGVVRISTLQQVASLDHNKE